MADGRKCDVSWARSNIASGACTGFIWLMSKAKYDEVDASRVGLVIAEVSCEEAGAGVGVGDDDGDGSLIYLCVC